jgi:hypothetical protein
VVIDHMDTSNLTQDEANSLAVLKAQLIEVDRVKAEAAK